MLILEKEDSSIVLIVCLLISEYKAFNKQEGNLLPIKNQKTANMVVLMRLVNNYG
jgi:hypothetical protein